jgi:hypothetical protein
VYSKEDNLIMAPRVRGGNLNDDMIKLNLAATSVSSPIVGGQELFDAERRFAELRSPYQHLREDQSRTRTGLELTIGREEGGADGAFGDDGEGVGADLGRELDRVLRRFLAGSADDRVEALEEAEMLLDDVATRHRRRVMLECRISQNLGLDGKCIGV